ncbi:MAG TPA: translocation/assembly module TamB domain-containing protein [Candidatus Entotheonella sp.]
MQLRGKLSADATQIELQHLQAHTLPAQVTLHTLQGTIQQRHGTIHIAALQFKTDATEMRTTGTLPGGPEPASLSLQFAPLDVGEIGRIVDDDTLQGRLQFSLAMTVDLPRNIWLQAPGTAIELQGNLDVTKQHYHPFVLGGDVAIVRGHATFLGKKFDLQSGEITFTGAEEINSLLDVTATHRVSRYTIYIHLEGESKAPQLTLSSDPELEQQDIISLLLFGRTSDRLTESEGVLSEQAQAAVASAVAGAAANVIGRELGIDSLSIRTGNSPDEARVRVGQHVTQDLFVSFESQFGRGGDMTIAVEKSLSRHLLLRITGSGLGESVIDLLWRYNH